jgi:hypothetical protein
MKTLTFTPPLRGLARQLAAAGLVTAALLTHGLAQAQLTEGTIITTGDPDIGNLIISDANPEFTFLNSGSFSETWNFTTAGAFTISVTGFAAPPLVQQSRTFELTLPANFSWNSFIFTSGNLVTGGWSINRDTDPRVMSFSSGPFVIGANQTRTDFFEFSVTQVPEPSTYALLLGGLGALAFVARRRRNMAAH